MKALLCGDRNWTNRDLIHTVIRNLKEFDGVTTIIQGEARGADTMAKEEAQKLGLDVLSFPANWRHYGRAAGPIRNQQMLTEGKPDMVIAFHNNITESKGTLNMIRTAYSAQVRYEIIGDDSSSFLAVDRLTLNDEEFIEILKLEQQRIGHKFIQSELFSASSPEEVKKRNRLDIHRRSQIHKWLAVLD